MTFDFSLQRMKALIGKEFIQLKRDRPTLVMIVMLPVMQLLLFGYAINMDPKRMPAAVILRDNTFLTRSLTAALEKSDYFKFTVPAASDVQGDRLLRRGDVIRGQKPSVLLQADASDPGTISGAVGALTQITDRVITREMTGSLARLRQESPAFSVQVQKSYNPEGFTRYNIVPGLIGIVLIFTGVMMTALALTRERERGTMENLLAMPVRPLEVMAGKITPFIFIGLFQALLILTIARYLFSIPVIGSFGLLFFCMALFIVCNLSLVFFNLDDC